MSDDENLPDEPCTTASITQTHQTTVTVERTWTIDHFSFYIDLDSKLPLLSAPIYLDHSHSPFILVLYPNGDSKANCDYISLRLRYCGHGTCPPYYQCQFSIINEDGKHRNTYHFGFFDTSSRQSKFIARSMLLDPANRYLQPNDQLKIYCKIIFNTDLYGQPAGEPGVQGHTTQLQSLLDSGKHSDFIISIGGTELPVHKAILGLRSAVFEVMFEHQNIKEAIEGRTVIEDVDLATFKVLLEYLYTGVIPEKEKLTEELLAAANKYLVDPLKLACEEHLSTILTPDSAVKLLELADIYDAPILKGTSIHFIVANASQIMTTNTWTQLFKTRPQLADVVLRSMAYKIEEFKKGDSNSKAQN